MKASNKTKFGWLLTNEVYSEKGIFNLRIFSNKNCGGFVGILKTTSNNSSAEDSTEKSIKRKKIEQHEVFGDSLKELYENVIVYVDLVSGKCITICQIERRL